MGSVAALWSQSGREALGRWLPDALVVVPVGATEQHGPHLATGTDAFLAEAVAWQGSQAAAQRSSRTLLVAPTIGYGVSGHHLPFGGTLSLKPATLLALLGDVFGSVAAQGGRRVVVVNGHGGNVGICQAAAADAASSLGLAVAHLDYWRLAPREDDVFAPGHAGEFETSLMLALHPETTTVPEARSTSPAVLAVEDVGVHTPALWQAIDGYTDEPAKAEAVAGRSRLDHLVARAADRFIELAEAL
ncbi:creatininase family protein [Mumia sp. Pv 4-285]|uniref:creatininase family protein n=1 Tax=Mumia qirimensis TaxID=3234852 RepID=UPI00351D3543